MLKIARKVGISLGLALIAISSFAQATGTLTLVKNGANPLPIILVQDAPPYLVRATDELADYIQKISGAKPEILKGLPNPIPASAIWVGYQPKLKELFPDADFNFKNHEEILIVANDKNIAITGRGFWTPETLKLEINGRKLDGKQMEYGTINAVYTFIQDYLNVRWIFPGDLGEDVIKSPTISLAPFTYRYHPQIRARGNLFHHSSLDAPSRAGRSQDWTRRHRLQLDSLESTGGHGFDNWVKRFFKSNPEYFALQPDGTRNYPNKTEKINYKMCMSNPAVLEQWLACVEEQIKANPLQSVFNASPMDDYATGHCVCENCKDWDNPNAELRKFNWKGIVKECPAVSDRDVTFANLCAAALKKRYPDKDYYVYMLSYGHSRPAPVGVKPADNVIIGSCSNFFIDRDSVDIASIQKGSTHLEEFMGWGKVTKNIFWRPNAVNPVGWWHGLPDIAMKETMETWKLIADMNCK
ncbi:MAG TPA: DUF4838 domain-containing protein, partial [Victivallales bacterium]|nr:DUF4838 domain-containing protein [Victivallales bacterium]